MKERLSGIIPMRRVTTRAAMWLRRALPGDFQVRINIGATPISPIGADPMGTANITGASTIHGSVSKPLFSAGTITMTAFRVVVTGTYGDTIVLGAGQIRYRKTARMLPIRS